MNLTLTPRQQQVLDFINAYRGRCQMPPTRTEIASHFNWKSANAAEDHLKALERKGAIVLKDQTARGIFVTGRAA